MIALQGSLQRVYCQQVYEVLQQCEAGEYKVGRRMGPQRASFSVFNTNQTGYSQGGTSTCQPQKRFLKKFSQPAGRPLGSGGLTAIYQFNLEGDDAGVYQINLSPGSVTVSEGRRIRLSAH